MIGPVAITGQAWQCAPPGRHSGNSASASSSVDRVARRRDLPALGGVGPSATSWASLRPWVSGRPSQASPRPSAPSVRTGRRPWAWRGLHLGGRGLGGSRRLGGGLRLGPASRGLRSSLGSVALVAAPSGVRLRAPPSALGRPSPSASTAVGSSAVASRRSSPSPWPSWNGRASRPAFASPSPRVPLGLRAGLPGSATGVRPGRGSRRARRPRRPRAARCGRRAAGGAVGVALGGDLEEQHRTGDGRVQRPDRATQRDPDEQVAALADRRAETLPFAADDERDRPRRSVCLAVSGASPSAPATQMP